MIQEKGRPQSKGEGLWAPGETGIEPGIGGERKEYRGEPPVQAASSEGRKKSCGLLNARRSRKGIGTIIVASRGVPFQAIQGRGGGEGGQAFSLDLTPEGAREGVEEPPFWRRGG